MYVPVHSRWKLYWASIFCYLFTGSIGITHTIVCHHLGKLTAVFLCSISLNRTIIDVHTLTLTFDTYIDGGDFLSYIVVCSF